MRQIKFRVWDKASKEFIDPTIFMLDSEGSVWLWHMGKIYPQDNDRFKVQQFTGLTMRLTTINQIVESILERTDTGNKSKRELVANEAVIYWKTFWVAEHDGIDQAMQYFFGTHNEDEYLEYRTSVVDPQDIKSDKDNKDNA